MSVPVANGESSASGSQHPSHAATSSSTPALSAFPPETVQRLPRSQFMAIEYPGILRKDGRKKEKKDEDVMDVDSGEEEEEEEEEEDLDVSPLGRALSSLSPVPPPHNHPGTALDHISDVLHQNTRLLECRLGSTYSPPPAPGSSSPSSSSSSSLPPSIDSLDIYKHPIIGDILPTNDILCKITKRVWRRVRPPGTASGDGGEPECVKEYHVELLGPISNTVRFRRMADFAFKPEFAPDVPGTQPDNAQVIRSSSSGGNTSITPPTTAEAPNPATVSSGKSDDSGTVNLGGSVSIHQLQSQLRRMDFDAISKFRFAEPNSRYEETVQGPDGEPVKRSTAFLVPPPIFSRQEVPWPYHYKHSTGSMLITYPKGEGQFERRYMNVQHYRGLGPTGVVLAALKDGPIPQGPDRVHQRQLIYVDQEILAKMKKLFEERPIWSKIALMNQFAAEDQLNLSNAKFYLPQVSFIIYDSCFRDCNVRYGYDVRKEPGSRLHQRVQFHFRNNARSNRRPTAMLQRADTSMPMTGDEDAAAAAAAAAPSSPPPADEDGEEQEDGGEDEDEVVAAEGEEEGEEEEEGNVPGRPTTGTKQDAAGRKRSHIFDGTTAANIGVQINYTLMDITDPMLQDYINVQGAINIRSSFDLKTGWYTRVAWERLRTALTVRVRSARFDRKPATRRQVEEAVRVRMTELKRRSGKISPGAGEVDWRDEGVSEEEMASTEFRDVWTRLERPEGGEEGEDEDEGEGEGEEERRKAVRRGKGKGKEREREKEVLAARKSLAKEKGKGKERQVDERREGSSGPRTRPLDMDENDDADREGDYASPFSSVLSPAPAPPTAAAPAPPGLHPSEHDHPMEVDAPASSSSASPFSFASSVDQSTTAPPSTATAMTMTEGSAPFPFSGFVSQAPPPPPPPFFRSGHEQGGSSLLPPPPPPPPPPAPAPAFDQAGQSDGDVSSSASTPAPAGRGLPRGSRPRGRPRGSRGRGRGRGNGSGGGSASANS